MVIIFYQTMEHVRTRVLNFSKNLNLRGFAHISTLWKTMFSENSQAIYIWPTA